MRVTPSQVVAVIDRQFADANPALAAKMDALHQGHKPIVAALLDLIDHIPPNLLLMSIEDFASFRMAIAAMRSAVEQWTHRDVSLRTLTALNDEHVIRVVRRVMLSCPDDAPALSTNDLTFIGDEKFRDVLRLDISSAERAFANGEWKAATVLSGSAIEALLYWSLLNRSTPADRQKAASSSNGSQLGQLPKDLTRWDLHQLAAVAAELKLIKAETGTQVGLARSFRNLIHPGVAERTATICDQGTAHAALAGLHHAIRELSK